MEPAVFLSLIAATTLIAWSRPKAYRRLYPALNITALCIAAYAIGAHTTAATFDERLWQFIPEDDWESASDLAAGGAMAPFGVLISCALALLFFYVLNLLVQVFELEEE